MLYIFIISQLYILVCPLLDYSMSDNSKSCQAESKKSRRHFLQLATAAGAAGIAGCSGGREQNTKSKSGDNLINAGNSTTSANDGTTSQEGTGPIIDPVINTSGQLPGVPTKLQYNSFGRNFDSTSNLTVYEQFAHFDLAKYLTNGEMEFIPRAAKEWLIPDKPAPGKKVTVTGADDRTWHNGDEIVAKDLYTTYRLNYFFGAPLYNYVDPDSLKTVGDRTVEFELTTTVNPNLLKMRLLGRAYGFRFSNKHDIYKDHLQRLEDAEKKGKDAVNKAKQDLVEFNLDKPIGTGWAKFVKRTDEKIVYEPHEDHPIGKDMEFDQWTNRYAPSSQQAWQYAIGKEVDVLGSSGPMSVIKKTQQAGFKMLLHNYLSASALTFNYDEKPFDDPRLHQAIAYAINFKKSVQPIKNQGEWGQQRFTVDTPTGIMVNQGEWIGDKFDKFTQYDPAKSNTDKVAKLMKDMGYSKQGGKWAKDGKALKVPIKAINSSEIITQEKSIVGDLKSAGFAAELQVVDTAKLTMDQVNGNYKVSTGYWGQSWHPATSFDVFTDKAGWQKLNHPKEIEVPMPIGNPNGKLQTINVHDVYQDMTTAPNDDEARSAVQTLAWAYNQTLPQIPAFMQYGMISIDAENFRFNFDRWNKKLMDAQFESMNRGLLKVKREQQ
ncbi:ABC transporter substrate-binding protein [Haladaptatus sp. CMAA 1911]|uniref:ABC transporter substrate-binding protein n=1 Tax=unclassified Haladaptatus TaxID=2622732 RepID=UPI003754F0F5